MMYEMTNDKRTRAVLLAERHPQLDFFSCDIFDATPKSDTASMEHPLFSLSTKADYKPKEYTSTDGSRWLKIGASPLGCATVHDRDILIYCISQLMAAINDNRPVEKKLRFKAHALLIATNRMTNGKSYKLLQNALKRLQGTQIETNITTGDKEQWKVFSFIDDAETIKKTRDGRMEEIEITLSDWMFSAIREKSGDLLTISRQYFRLRKPLERRLYEIARKHCGNKNAEWKFKMKTLHEKMGSQSTLKEFRRMMINIVEENSVFEHIPDYTFELKDDTVYIRPKPKFSEIYDRPALPSEIDQMIDRIKLKPQAYERARPFAGGWDMYNYLEMDWRRMLKNRQTVPRHADDSFIGFVKWYVKKNGKAQ